MNNPIGGTFDKIDVINDAYSQLRISGLTVVPTPADLELALSRLEDMAAEWAERNICSEWNFEDQPDPNSPSNVRRGYKQAFSTNLAVRLIPDFNKDVPIALMKQAVQSLSNLSGRKAMESIQGVNYPARMPRGSGNTLRYNRWNRFYRGQNFAPNSCKTVSMFIGDINSYVEHFDAYLNDGEILSSVDFSLDSGLVLQASSFTDNDVSYTIKATGATTDRVGADRQMTIIATTDAGRVETRVVNFSLSARPESN